MIKVNYKCRVDDVSTQLRFLNFPALLDVKIRLRFPNYAQLFLLTRQRDAFYVSDARYQRKFTILAGSRFRISVFTFAGEHIRHNRIVLRTPGLHGDFGLYRTNTADKHNLIKPQMSTEHTRIALASPVCAPLCSGIISSREPIISVYFRKD